jgi:2-polyprenyl-6-methoxyphenol hydroxylase-like FAD-dependent oxidoreductase
MRIACVGAGPGGLFLSLLVKRHRPDWDVVLFERNRSTDSFGFGVVFSDATLRAINEADPVLSDALAEHGVHWSAIEVWAKGDHERFDGNGMAAIRRSTLLSILQDHASAAGVDLRFETMIPSAAELGDFDIVVAADGSNSNLREQTREPLRQHVETADAKFIWFGSTYIFPGLTFVHAQNEHGNFAVHGYPISDDTSTFIVETDEATWRRAGLDEFDVTAAPGPSDEKSRRYLTDLFADQIPGGELLVNNSRWANFKTRRTDHWYDGNTVFLGDAVHTAHFSVGSGTKMAMEDAIVLAREITSDGSFERYQSERKPAVARIQDAAVPSLAWWERFGEYYRAFEPWQFAFHFFSRSIPIDKIRQRDPAFVTHVEDSWNQLHGTPVLETTLELAGVVFSSRFLQIRDESIVDGAGATVGLDVGQVVDACSPDTIVPDAAFVVVAGGSPVERAAVAERVRLESGVATVIVDPDADRNLAETLVLSGRADAVIAGGRIPPSRLTDRAPVAAYAVAERRGGRR